MVGVSTTQGGETIEDSSIASKQATVGVSTTQGGRLKQKKRWLEFPHAAKGWETTEANSI